MEKKNIVLPEKINIEGTAIIPYSQHEIPFEEKNFKDEVEFSVSDNIQKISLVSKEMEKIKKQNPLLAHFNKIENIQALANSVINVATVEKSSLDLIVLLLGATVGQNNNYTEIIERLDELKENFNSGTIELEQLVKMKKAIHSLRVRDKLFEDIIERVNLLIDLTNFQNEKNDLFNKELAELKSTISDLQTKLTLYSSQVERNITSPKNVKLMYFICGLSIFISVIAIILSLVL